MPSGSSNDIDEMINGLKSGLGLWEDLILKSSKFSSSIKSMLMASSDFLNSMYTICDNASKSSCGLRNTGITLSKLVFREKRMELKVTSINDLLNDNFVAELEKCVSEWRRSSAIMKKERDHEWKRANIEYQKSLAEVERTGKKLKKKNTGKMALPETAVLQIEYTKQDVQNKRRYVEELKRCALRSTAIEERQRYKQFLLLLRPILDCQLSLREDLNNLEEVVNQLYGENAQNLDLLPEDLDQNIQECISESYNTSLTNQRGDPTLPRKHNLVPAGSKISLTNSVSTTSSEWNNNISIDTSIEASFRTNENKCSISYDSEIKSDKSVVNHYEVNANNNYKWDKNLTQVTKNTECNNPTTIIESGSEEFSTEDDNYACMSHNVKDGIPDNINDLTERHSNEEPQFKQSSEYLYYFPTPPSPPASVAISDAESQSKYCQSFNDKSDMFYPNQSLPSAVYSNLSEFKINPERKFGKTLKERGQASQSFTNKNVTSLTPVIEKVESYQVLSSADLKEQDGFNIPPPALYSNGNVIRMSTFGTLNNGDENGTPKEETKTSFKSTDEQEMKTMSRRIPGRKDQEIINISPASNFSNIYEEVESSFDICVNKDTTQINLSKIPQLGDTLVKSSSIHRSSYATEMELPQTPKSTNRIRPPSIQEKMSSNRNRGRSMSVTRESNCKQDSQETTSKDADIIRERTVSHNKYEWETPELVKSCEKIKQLPNALSTSPNRSLYLSSPNMIRSNRFYGDPTGTQSMSRVALSQNLTIRYKHGRVSGLPNQNMESAAPEDTADKKIDMTSIDLHHATVSRNEDTFKKQLMNALQKPKSIGTINVNQFETDCHSQTPSSSYNLHLPSANTDSGNNAIKGKPKTKSSIPASKYNF